MYKNSTSTDKSSYFYHVIFISISFMVLMSGYQTAENLISHLYKDLGLMNLGEICISLIYVSFGTGSILAPYIKRKLSTKLGLVAGGIPYVTFMLTGVIATYCHQNDLHEGFCGEFSIYSMNLLFSVVLGFGAAILWLSQANYVNDCTSDSNRGTYVGIFQSVMQTSMLFGSLMAVFVLGNVDELMFFIVVTGLAIISVVMFMFLPSLAAKQNQAPEEQKSFVESTRAFFDCFRNPIYYPVILSCFTCGIIVSFFVTYYPTAVRDTIMEDNTNVVNQRISFCLINLGFGELASGYLVGRMIDRFPKLKISDYIFGFVELTYLTTFIAVITQSYILSLVSGFLWGASDNAAKTMTINLICAKFNGKLELFALNRAVQSFGVVIGSLATAFLSKVLGSFYVILMLGVLVCCHIGFNMMYKNIDLKSLLEIELLEKERPASYRKKISEY